jgi:glycosyltransferase involved in cell wall biosynthesis
MSKVKILYLVDGFNPGGAERQLYELVKNIDKKRFDVNIITWYPSTFFSDIHTVDKVTWVQRLRTNRFDIKPLLEIFKTARRNNRTIIHAYLDTAGLYGAIVKLLLRKKVLLITTERSSFKELKFFQRYYKPISHKVSDLVITNSNAGKQYIDTFSIKASHIKVVHNGIDFSRFNTGSPDESIGSRIPKDKRVLLCAARITNNKNQIGLLTAFSESLLRENWVVVLIGSANQEYVQEVQAFIQSNNLKNSVLIFEPSTQIDLYFQLSDAVVLFSYFEGTPNAVMEGMAAAKPVIASRVGDVPLLLDDSCGRIVEPGNHAELKNVFDEIARMSSDEMRSLGKKAQEKLMEMKCDVRSMVREHEMIYESLINEGKEG